MKNKVKFTAVLSILILLVPCLFSLHDYNSKAGYIDNMYSSITDVTRLFPTTNIDDNESTIDANTNNEDVFIPEDSNVETDKELDEIFDDDSIVDSDNELNDDSFINSGEELNDDSFINPSDELDDDSFINPSDDSFIDSGEESDEDIKNKIANMILNEDDFANELQKSRKFTDANKKTYTFSGIDNVQIYCESHIVKNPKATIVISPGYTENMYAYDEMNYYFNKMGYSTFGLEHRGHSRSGRLGRDEYQVNVNSFEDYVDDLNTFIEKVVKANTTENSKLYLFGHSMGGLVATRYLEKYPNTFEKASINSPMLGVNFKGIPSGIAKIIASGANLFFANEYVAGKPAYDKAVRSFEKSSGVSKPRYDALTAGPRNTYKEVQCGGPSYKWLAESIKEIEKTLDANNKKKIIIPIKLCVATNDVYVDESGSEKFAKGMQNVDKVDFDNVKHEIYKSTNETLEKYLFEIFSYYAH